MIVITISNDGQLAFVHEVEPGEKPVDVSKDWICNQLAVQDNDDRTIAGFHIGKDVTAQVKADAAAAVGLPEAEEERFIGDGR